MNASFWAIFILVLFFSLSLTLYQFKLITFENRNISSIYQFFYKITPYWFNWLGWVSILSVIQYAYQKTNDKILFFVYYGTLLLLFGYFKYIFAAIEFKWAFLKRKKEYKKSLEAGLAAYCSLCALYFSFHIAKIIEIILNP